MDRDEVGRVKRITESWQGGSASVFGYGYDLPGWFDSVVVNGRVVRYQYDANGSRTAVL